jgi:hypothetical protein
MAAAQGAKNALLVDGPAGLPHLTGFPGKIARVSYAGFLSGLMHNALEQREHFDLCVIEVPPEDITRFSELADCARPYLQVGATIIGFSMPEGPQLSMLPRSGENDELVARSSVFSSLEKAIIGQLRHVRLIWRLLVLGLNIPRFWWANRAAAAAKNYPKNARGAGATITLRIPQLDDKNGAEFASDDGTLDYAAASGLYLGAAVEAPVASENRGPAGAARGPDTAVILTFGQSNAANAGASRYIARHPVHSFNIFDMNYYRAVDPLPGAGHNGGSVWGRLGDKLIETGRYRSVLIVPIAVGGSCIKDWTPPDGYCWRRIKFALGRLKRAGIGIDMMCWHHGETDANRLLTSAQEYRSRFQRLVRQIRAVGVDAPIYVATASVCANGFHPYRNHEQIRLAQRELVSSDEGIFHGPDTDQFVGDYRQDGCHFSEKGLEAVAQAWLECIMQDPTRVHGSQSFELAQGARIMP